MISYDEKETNKHICRQEWVAIYTYFKTIFALWREHLLIVFPEVFETYNIFE